MKRNMRWNHVLLIATLSTFIIFIAACQSKVKVTEFPITLEQVLNETNERNQSSIKTFKPTQITNNYYDVGKEDLTSEELEKLFTPGYMTGVKPTQAKEDIDVLFRILKSSYAGYTYFGAARTFDQAKQNILNNIEAYGEKSIPPSDFTKLIRDQLDFVIDSHLLIGRIPLSFEEAFCWYDDNAFEYFRDSNGYYTILDNKKWYLAENWKPYLRYTIGKSGEIVYGLFYVGTDTEKAQIPSQLTLVRKNKEKVIEIRWTKSSPKSSPDKEYVLTGTDGIKTAVIAAFSATQNANTMINDAKELSKEDYAIIDLRNNSGGLIPDVTMWMYNFVNKELYLHGTSLSYHGIVNDYWQGIVQPEILKAYQYFDFFKENKELVNNIINYKSEFYTVTKIKNEISRFNFIPQWTPRDGKILFLLNGKENVSCGEYFLEVCKSLENTLIVGTNSGGCLTTGGVNSYIPLYLPNSKIEIIYSTQLMLSNRSQDFDQYGIMPDIYIGSGNEAEAVAKCIRYYQSYKTNAGTK